MKIPPHRSAQRSVRAPLLLLAFAVVGSVGAAGCKQAVGDRCQLDTDCMSNHCVIPASGSIAEGGVCADVGDGPAIVSPDMLTAPSDMSASDMSATPSDGSGPMGDGGPSQPDLVVPPDLATPPVDMDPAGDGATPPLPDLKVASLPDLAVARLPDLAVASLPDLRPASLPDLSSLPDLHLVD